MRKNLTEFLDGLELIPEIFYPLDEEVSSPTSTCFTKDKRPVTVKKKSKPIHKTNSVRKLFQSVKRKSPVAQTTKGSHLSSIIDVKDATISQDQIKDLMTKVKHHEISQDQAIAEAEK